jgi:hypothetical protein
MALLDSGFVCPSHHMPTRVRFVPALSPRTVADGQTLRQDFECRS